ncbi:hypothetical protein AVEN_93370-1 [Araneus ventricosus]|uniref:Uncharacterized protein n=1 Tax=Araneus ventricosus TaxID=182803 RepID=A0A4Y2AQV3_ARAVE|nr:hypothetical protein AVEN_93370-1 [Araneus ventricosus]
MLLICMLGQIPKLPCPGCHHFPAVGSRSSPIGPRRSWTSFLGTDGVMYRPRRIQLILAPEVCPPRIFLTVVWEGPTWLSSPEADWPKQPVLKDSDEHVLKERKKTTFVFSVFLKNDSIDALIKNILLILS